MTSPSDVQRRLALKMRLNKIDGVGVTAPIILHEVLTTMNYNSRLMQGYCVMNGTKDACWHVVAMVEDATSETSQVLDIGCDVSGFGH